MWRVFCLVPTSCFVKIVFVCHAIAMLLKSFDFPGLILSMAWQPCNPCGLAAQQPSSLDAFVKDKLRNGDVGTLKLVICVREEVVGVRRAVNCGDRKRLERAMAQLKLDSGIKTEAVFVLQERIMTVATFAEGKVVWFQDALWRRPFTG